MIDHYAVLGLPKFTPTPNEIKKSFRKLAIKWHPDKCKASNANDIFSNISTAYEILYDEDSKRKYDRELRLASTIASVASCTTTTYNTNTSNFPRRSSSAGSSQYNNDNNSYPNNNNSNSSSYRYKKNVNKNRFKQRKKHNYQYSRKHTSGFDQWHYDYRNPQHNNNKNNNNNNNNRASMSQGSSRSNHSNYTSSSADEDDDMYYSSSSSQNSSRASSRASSSNAGETSRVANAFANVFGDGDFEKAADHWDNMMYVNHLPCLPTYPNFLSIYLSIYLSIFLQHHN